MIILFENTLKHYTSIGELSGSKLCIVRYEKPLIDAKQIVIEDLGFSREVVSRTETIKYMYSLAESYSHRFSLNEREYVFVINGNSSFDLGFSLYLINKIYNTVDKPHIILIIEIPRLDTIIDVRARFMSWLKTIFLHDIFVNSNGFMKIVFTDPDSPPQLIKFLIIFLTSNLLMNYRSILHIKLKRFIVPLTEIYFLIQLLTLRGKLVYLIENYKKNLFLMNKVLDQAPTELWSIARKSTNLIRGSIYSFKKIVDSLTKLEKTIEDSIKILVKSSRFSELAVDPRELLDKLMSGYTIGEIHNDVFSSERIVNYLNISRDLLVDTYSYGTVTNCEYSRFVSTGEDLFDKIPPGFSSILLENTFNELNIIDTCSVSINNDCKYNTSYIPFNYIDAYFEASGLYLESLYPRELVFKNNIVKPIDIHNTCLVNYSGYLKAVSEKCGFSGLKLIKSIVEKY